MKIKIWRFADSAKQIVTLFFLMLITLGAIAQKVVTGTVKEKGVPLVGATVAVKGASVTTLTDANGNFSITLPSGRTSLLISSVGYDTQSIDVGNQSQLDVEMVSVSSTLNEVVVTGYGTQRRKNVTGAISSINNKTLNEIPAPNLAQALQGRMPGVSVVNNSTPGSQPIVRIRGISSISFASDPLYVVDGIPTGNISSFDMQDIETIDVLKDASAAAIYGSRASNGVIMITTRKGKRDRKLHVGLNSYYGVQRITERLDLLNPTQFDAYSKAYNGKLVARRDPNNNPVWVTRPIYAGASTTYGNNVTDWQDEYFEDGPMTETNITLSGGNEISRFSASGGYYKLEGTAPNVAFQRYSFKINSDHIISKVFTFGQTLVASNSIQKGDANAGGTRSNLVNVIRMMPYMPVYDPTTNGGYRGVISGLDGGDPTNPIEDAELKNPQENSTVKILGTAFLEINILKGLQFKSTFGIDYANGRFYRFTPIFNDSGTVNGAISTIAGVTDNRNTSTVLLYTEQLTYNRQFGKHNITATGVFESQNLPGVLIQKSIRHSA